MARSGIFSIQKRYCLNLGQIYAWQRVMNLFFSILRLNNLSSSVKHYLMDFQGYGLSKRWKIPHLVTTIFLLRLIFLNIYFLNLLVRLLLFRLFDLHTKSCSPGRMTNDSDCTLWNFSRNHMESSRINLKCMIIFSMAETLNELKQFLAES